MFFFGGRQRSSLAGPLSLFILVVTGRLKSRETRTAGDVWLKNLFERLAARATVRRTSRSGLRWLTRRHHREINARRNESWFQLSPVSRHSRTCTGSRPPGSPHLLDVAQQVQLHRHTLSLAAPRPPSKALSHASPPRKLTSSSLSISCTLFGMNLFSP